jgi:hypothetical protein
MTENTMLCAAFPAESRVTAKMEFPAGVGASTLGGFLTNFSDLMQATSEVSGFKVEVFCLRLELTGTGFEVEFGVVPTVQIGEGQE